MYRSEFFSLLAAIIGAVLFSMLTIWCHSADLIVYQDEWLQEAKDKGRVVRAKLVKYNVRWCRNYKAQDRRVKCIATYEFIHGGRKHHYKADVTEDTCRPEVTLYFRKSPRYAIQEDEFPKLGESKYLISLFNLGAWLIYWRLFM